VHFRVLDPFSHPHSLEANHFAMASRFNPMSLQYIAPETVDPKPTQSPTQTLPSLSQALRIWDHGPLPEVSKPRLPGFFELDLHVKSESKSMPVYGSRHLRPSSTTTHLFPVHHVDPAVYHRAAYRSLPPHGFPPSPPLSTSSGSSFRSFSRSVSPGSPQQQASKMPTREDRHEYDLEEKFAMCYLRIQSDSTYSRWKDLVDNSWPILFPPGELRRASAPLPPDKTLPSTYSKRSGGALQCRYYRARDTAGMGQVRKGHKTDPKAEQAGLRRLELDLVQHWFKKLDHTEIVHLGLTRLPHEHDVAYMARVRMSYHKHSQFWQILRSLRGLHHY
jgi:hypothetical protein